MKESLRSSTARCVHQVVIALTHPGLLTPYAQDNLERVAVVVNSARMQVTQLIIAKLGYYHGAHFCLLLGCVQQACRRR